MFLIALIYSSFSALADMPSNAPTLAKKLGIGWNVGNSLEACSGVDSADETSWGNPLISNALIAAVKKAGFTTIRIPCAWSGYIEDKTTFKIKASWLQRVKTVVDYVIDNGLYAIINIHWDGGWLEEHPLYADQDAVNAKQKALWTQIATYFQDYGEKLLFAGCNEVHDGYGTPTTENIEVHNSYLQTFVDAVRATGGNNPYRNLIVQGYNTNIEHTVNYLTIPTDKIANRLFVEVHFYDPWDFAGDENSNVYLWGKQYAGNSHVSSWGQEDWVDKAFGMIQTNFVSKNIPAILGEYGAIKRTSLSSSELQEATAAREYYLNYITKTATDNGLIPIYWDNGNSGNNGFALFNRNNGAVVDQGALDAIVKS